MRTRWFQALCAAPVFLALGCSDSTSAATSLSGKYILVSSNSASGVGSGWITLNDDGTAIRTFSPRGVHATQVYSETGTYQVVGRDSITFAFNEVVSGSEPYVWHVSGPLRSNHFTLIYPGAADGIAEEEYQSFNF